MAVFDDEVTDVSVGGIDHRAREGAEGMVGRAHDRGAIELAGSGAEVVGLDIPQNSGIRVHNGSVSKLRASAEFGIVEQFAGATVRWANPRTKVCSPRQLVCERGPTFQALAA